MTISELYVRVDGLLFKLHIDPKEPNEYMVTLAIREVLSVRIFEIFHNCLIGQHHGLTKCYLTIRWKFHIIGLFDKIGRYVISY